MRVRFIPFEKLPYSDSCWSLIEGPDDRVYAAGCAEHSPGGTVYVVRYDPETEELEYLLDVAEVFGESPGNGRATQCKIHYSLLVADDGVMYGATHLSGPAVGQVRYDPWATFNDPDRSYLGALMFAYDTTTEEVLWTDKLIPWEGCRCLALDQHRARLYAVGYPRDHFYRYDLDGHERADMGRLGSVNPQAIWMDGRGRAYTTGDDGRIVCYDPADETLNETDLYLPTASYQSGWHNVIYDVVRVPDSEDVVGVTWNVDPRIFRFSPGNVSGRGEVRDFGPAGPGIEGQGVRGLNTDHAGGLVFLPNGDLLYGATRPADNGDRYGRVCVLKRMNVETGESEEIGELHTDEGRPIGYVSRAVRIGPRDIVLGVVGPRPTGIVHVTLPDALAEGPHQETPRRYWG